MLKRILTLTTVMALSLTAYAHCREEVPPQDEFHLVKVENENNEMAHCGCEKGQNDAFPLREEEENFLCQADEQNEDSLAKCACEDEENLLFHSEESKEDSLAKCACEDEENLLCHAEEQNEDSLAKCTCEDEETETNFLCHAEEPKEDFLALCTCHKDEVAPGAYDSQFC